MCSRSARERMDSRPSERSASTMSRSVSSIGAMCPLGRSDGGSLAAIWLAYPAIVSSMSRILAVNWIYGLRWAHDQGVQGRIGGARDPLDKHETGDHDATAVDRPRWPARREPGRPGVSRP